MIMTSPPYWGLRTYGGEEVKTIWGGDPKCEHEWGGRIPPRGHKTGKHGPGSTIGAKIGQDAARRGSGSSFCSKCGAWRGQLGLEPTWQMYVEHLVEISQELKRVLRKDSSYYLNLGDTYAGSGMGYGSPPDPKHPNARNGKLKPRKTDIPAKCKLLMPYRVALALIDDGWICRNDVTWYKSNAMPSSVKDRLTCKTEQIFHFVKSRKYYYDLDAIREPHKTSSKKRAGKSGVVPFNLRVRDVKRGKKGSYVAGGKVKELTASQEEVEGYVYPEKLDLDALKAHCLKEYEKVSKSRVAYDHKGGSDAPSSFHAASEWNKGTRQTMNAIINSLDVPEAVKSRLRSWWHDRQGHPKGKNPGDVVLTKHDIAVRRFPTVNRQGGLGYTDPLHVKPYHAKGKNPGDVFRNKTANQEKIMSMRNAPEPGEPHVFHELGKNPGDFWEINTRPYPDAHFATYPEEICIKPILSSCPEWVCKKCGKPRERITKSRLPPLKDAEIKGMSSTQYGAHNAFSLGQRRQAYRALGYESPPAPETIGFTDCGCGAGFEPGVVLDLFLGRGTTTKVARDNGRNSIGIEIQPSYLPIIKKYLEIDQQQQRLGVTYEIIELDDHL